ncbi:MAG: PIG-L deacetylase family protein [Anaerolineae bacterium]
MNSQNQASIPDLHRARKILCVQPHYDDNDIGAGGTIAALQTAGAAIIYLTVTDDLVGVVDPTLTGEAAAARLKKEQEEAGSIIGVSEQYWLGYPDAGKYDYFELRRNIIKFIRLLRPDFLFTVDPWLLYEAHRDHIQAGLAVAEASYLQRFPRLPSDPEVDRNYEPYDIAGVAFYFTHTPNTIFDITKYREIKHRAIDVYRTQFSPGDMAHLHTVLDLKEREWAEGENFSYAEAFKVLRPSHLHVNTDAWRL